MKKNNHIIYLLLGVVGCVLTVSSCLKDEGNYNYVTLPDFYIDTIGQQTSFEIRQSVETLTIDPTVVVDVPDTDLVYQWRLYGGGGTIDTLGTEKVLDTFVGRAPGTYTAELQVTKRSIGLSALMRYQVIVVAPVPSGWMVAYEKDGGTDVDLIRAPEFISGVQDNVLRNVYSTTNGAVLPGSPVSVLYISSSISYVFTTVGGVKVQNTDFATAQDFNQLFIGNPPSIVRPEAFWLGSFNRGTLVNNGSVYWFDSDVIVGEISIDSRGYEAAPYIYAQLGQYGGFYDQRNMRFAIIQQQTSQAGLYADANSTAQFNLNNIGKELLFIERGFGQTNNDPHKYAFFKDVSGPGRYFYGINTATPATPDIVAVDISSAPDILDAKFYGVGNLGPCAFYGTEDKVYNFQIDYSDNSISTPTVGFQATAGEEITCMKLFKGQGTFGVGAITGANESRLMYVATWNGSEGKVYLLNVNVTSGELSAPVKSWTVGGKVLDMSYKQV